MLMTDSHKPNFKRRTYYIDKKFQARFVLIFLLVLVVGGGLSIALTMLSTQETLTSTYGGGGLAIEKTASAILPSVVLTTLVTTAIIGVVVLILTLLISHRIAGPMFRFEQDLKQIAKGDLQKKIHIRDGDQFAGMVENLNGMVESFNGKLLVVQNGLDGLAVKAREQHLSQTFIDDIEECRATLNSEFRL